ncbi:MAG: hypothetical protein LC745_08920 [Planctomycetia bacterium]|nr:hypothetical protein [Planctomycetia bacterium]
MPTPFNAPRRLATALGVATLLAAAVASGADDKKTQTIDGRGITFDAPSSWKQESPQSEMRRAQLKVEAAKGDDRGAEVVLFAFPGGGGGVDANVARWQESFSDKDGNPPKVDVKTVKGKNVDVNRVEIAGKYNPKTFPGQKKQEGGENYRLLGAIVLTTENGYFLRMVGPEKTVAGARDDFDKLIASIKVDEK